MSQLFVNQVGLFNEEGKAEFMVRRPTEKALEGTRVMAASAENAKEVFTKLVKEVVASL